MCGTLHGPDILRIIADPESRKLYIKGAHEGLGLSTEAKAIGSHLRWDKTPYKLLDSGFWWPGMNTEVHEFVSCCDACQKAGTKMDKAAPSLPPVSVPQHVWMQIGVGLCNLPQNSDHYVGLSSSCQFSKWIEAKPVYGKTTDKTALFLYDLICRYGCAKIQINDQGGELCINVSCKLFNLTGTRQRITSAYHSQANGLVERANRTIQGMLLSVLETHQEN